MGSYIFPPDNLIIMIFIAQINPLTQSSMCFTLGYPDTRTCLSGSDTTLSVRKRYPAWSTPGVQTGMNTSGVKSGSVAGVASKITGISALGGLVFVSKLDIHTRASASLFFSMGEIHFSRCPH